MPRGNYGDILLTGITSHVNRRIGLLQYKRTGTFQPDLIISELDYLLVTDSLQRKIELTDLKGFQFKSVIKQHISFVD